MSLSFVSKSIQTTTEDGGFEEKPIVSSQAEQESSSSSLSADRRPLFEQLRQNKERQDAEEEEFQRSKMRSMLALDEEDVAHLNALDRQKTREEEIRAQQTAQELAAFRAARADRMESSLSTEQYHEEVAVATLDSNTTTVKDSALGATAALVMSKPATRLVLPTIIKRKRRVDHDTAKTTEGNTETDDSSTQKKPKAEEMGIENEDRANESDKQQQQKSLETPVGGIGGLLAGYDSSSGEE